MTRWAPRPITLRQLQYLLAMVEFKDFRRAAEACAVAQPSLSAQVTQLEAALGVAVFERSTREVTVTRAGATVPEISTELRAKFPRFEVAVGQGLLLASW